MEDILTCLVALSGELLALTPVQRSSFQMGSSTRKSLRNSKACDAQELSAAREAVSLSGGVSM
eukprot:1867735-Amphidinium_carterae.1